MERSRYLELLKADGDLLRAAATDLDADVPPCPGWTVRDAVAHVAEVYEHKLACIALRGGKPDPWPPQWPAGRDPREWFDDAFARLLDTLSTVDAAAPSHTWWPHDHTAGFWIRRMAQETAVHRVDVQSASGSVTPVDADLATDGVDEVLDMMLGGPWWDSDEYQEPDLVGTYGVSTGGRTWRVAMEPRKVTVTEGDASDADATVSGEPSDVLLWLWGRVPDGAVTLTGDASTFRKRLAIATE